MEIEIKEKIHNYHSVIICDTPSHIRNIILKYCYENSIRTYTVPKVSDILIMGSERMHLFDTPLLLQRNQGLNGDQLIVKRAMDRMFSIVLYVSVLKEKSTAAERGATVEGSSHKNASIFASLPELKQKTQSK